ncbi:MAG: GAF domain-containing protein [Chloroflexi bacterium CFX4]|nr:GAF domain-containing protein [Chloroflexi bacterium CFX4]MDL1923270.1 GAF domain-containing protein [Chloroflexi bacterium CFX3]
MMQVPDPPSVSRSGNRRSLVDLLVQIDSDLLRAQTAEEILGALRPVLAYYQAQRAKLHFLYTDAHNRPTEARLVASLRQDGSLEPLSNLPALTFRLAEYPFVARTVEQRQPYFIENIFTHPDIDEQMLAYARAADYTAIIALPLFVHERWLGFLSLDWQQAQHFNDATRIFFKTLQTNVAAVVAGYRSYIEREEAHREIELLYRIGSAVNAAQTYAELIQAVARYAPMHPYSLSITHFENYDLQNATYAEIVAVWGANRDRLGTRIPDQALLPLSMHRKPVIVTDTADLAQVSPAVSETSRARGYRAFLSVPLTYGETVLGALNFFSDKPRDYSAAEQRLAKGIADLVAVAMDRIRLREESLRSQARTECIAQINTALLLATDEADIVRAFASYAAQLGAVSVSLSYIEPGDTLKVMRLAAVYSKDGVLTNFPLATPAVLNGKFSAQLLKRGEQLVCVEDAQTDPRLDAQERAALVDYGISAMASMLLHSGGEWVGVLNMNWDHPRKFHEDERTVFEAILPPLASVVGRRRLWLKQLETLAQLRQLDRLKDEFLSNMSHELRTPLNAIIGLSDVILQGMDGELTPRMHNDVQTIYNAGQQLLAIVNDVLDIAKIEAGTLTLRFAAINICTPLREALETAQVMATTKGISLIADLSAQLPLVRADANRIRQVALNLLTNAIKFTDRGTVTLSAYAEGDRVIFCVRDEGIGIDPAHHCLIFEQFRQVEGSLHRRKGGAGLGLAISKRLVELHQGKIRLVSALGKGATFYVSLPAIQ